MSNPAPFPFTVPSYRTAPYRSGIGGTEVEAPFPQSLSMLSPPPYAGCVDKASDLQDLHVIPTAQLAHGGLSSHVPSAFCLRTAQEDWCGPWSVSSANVVDVHVQACATHLGVGGLGSGVATPSLPSSQNSWHSFEEARAQQAVAPTELLKLLAPARPDVALQSPETVASAIAPANCLAECATKGDGLGIFRKKRSVSSERLVDQTQKAYSMRGLLVAHLETTGESDGLDVEEPWMIATPTGSVVSVLTPTGENMVCCCSDEKLTGGLLSRTSSSHGGGNAASASDNAAACTATSDARLQAQQAMMVGRDLERHGQPTSVGSVMSTPHFAAPVSVLDIKSHQSVPSTTASCLRQDVRVDGLGDEQHIVLSPSLAVALGDGNARETSAVSGVSGLAELPSLGSALHHLRTCKPCAFVLKAGCQNGKACQFCHLCEVGEKKRRKKEKVAARRLSRDSAWKTMTPDDAFTSW